MNENFYTEIVGLSELDTKRRSTFEYYVNQLILGETDDLCSCDLKKDVWDTRIINLKELSLYRFSNPMYADNLDDIKGKLLLLNDANLCALLSFGMFDKQVWYKRKLFRKEDLLSFKIETERVLRNWKKIIIGILQYVELLWKSGIFHGDINEDNIVFDGERYILVDPIFSYISSHNNEPSFNDDICGLKKLFEKISKKTNFISLDFIFDSLTKDSVKIAIDKINKIETSSFIPMSSGVILKKKEKEEILPLDNDESGKKEINPFQENMIPTGKIFNKIEKNNEQDLNDEKDRKNTVNFREQEKYVARIPRTETVIMHAPQDKTVLYLLFFCLLGVLLFYNKDKLPKLNIFNSNQEKLLEYEYSWSSNQPIFMKEIVAKALKGDSLAQITIVNFVLEGKKHSPYVNNLILKTIFNPLWEDDLTDDDKYTAFRLSVPKLVSVEEKSLQIQALEELHPSIALAVAGSVALDAPISQLKNVSLDKMSHLTGIYGDSFKKLSLLGVKTLDEFSSRALSNIFVLGENDDGILGFLSDSANNELILRGKLLILLDLVDKKIITADKLYKLIKEFFGKALAPLIDFFKTNDWKQVGAQDLLSFIVGKFPKDTFDVQLYIDLLSYPLKNIREESVKVLSQNKKLNKKVLEFIAEGNTKLSRDQIYILLSLFLIDGSKQHAIVEKFFEENPDDLTVLSILLFRNDESSEDIFNFEAARYLSHKRIDLPENIIWELAKHPEPMARAIAYSRLDMTNPKHKSFLEDKRKTEKSDMLKVLISKRLE